VKATTDLKHEELSQRTHRREQDQARQLRLEEAAMCRRAQWLKDKSIDKIDKFSLLSKFSI